MSKLWEHYGAHDPYYGVLSTPEFHVERMDADARKRFFASGARDVDASIERFEREFGPLTFDTALDYGCGAGRLSSRLAERFQRVIAVDISESMISVARANIGRANATFENAAQMSTGPVNFILSLMVLQHIPTKAGLQILTRLGHRGPGVIELPIRDKAGSAWRALRLAKRALHAVMPIGRPVIPMYTYRESDVVAALGGRVTVDHFDSPMFEYARMIFTAASPP